MLFYALVCLSIILLTVGYCAIFKRRFEEVAALAVLTDILVVYAAGIVDRLSLGTIAVLVVSIGVMIIALCVSLSRGDGATLAQNVFTLGFVIFLVAMPVIYFACKDLTFAGSASTSQVTGNIELFFSNESMKTVEVAGFGKLGWQPGYSLFGYMFTALNSSLDEGMAIGGGSVFALAMILPMLKKIKWKNIIEGVFMTATVILIPWLLNMRVFNTLNADAAAALIMAFMLMAYLGSDYSGYGFFSLGMGSAVLFIIQPGSEILAVVMLVIVIVDIAALGFKKIVPMFECGKWFSIVIYIGLALGGFLSWWVFAAKNGINRLFDVAFFTEQRAALFETKFNVVSEYFSKGVISGLPIYGWFILLALLGAAAALLMKNRTDRIRMGVRALLILGGYWILSLGLTYAFTYCYPVGMDFSLQASRLLSGYMVAGILCMFTLVIESILERFENYFRMTVIALFLIMIFIAPVPMAFAEMFGPAVDAVKTII